MSGWRSGSGDRTSLVEDAIADPASVFDPTGRRRANLGAFLVVFVATIAIMIASIWYDASLRPPHRALPAPAQATVTIVPIGALPNLLDGVPEAYREVYGLTLTIAQPVTLDPAIVGSTGGPAPAEAIANAALAAEDGRSLVIAVTADPIAPSGSDADGDIAERFYGRVAVISTYPLVSMKTISRATLFRKVLTRQIGFLVWGLQATDDPYDLLYRSVLNEIDVERVSDHL